MELIVTSAIGCQIGQDPHGLRLVKVQETEVEHAYHGLDVCPTNITFKNSDSSIEEKTAKKRLSASKKKLEDIEMKPKKNKNKSNGMNYHDIESTDSEVNLNKNLENVQLSEESAIEDNVQINKTIDINRAQ